MVFGHPEFNVLPIQLVLREVSYWLKIRDVIQRHHHINFLLVEKFSDASVHLQAPFLLKVGEAVESKLARKSDDQGLQ